MVYLGNRVTKKTAKKKPAKKRVAKKKPARAAVSSTPVDLGKGSTIKVVVSNPHYSGTGTIDDAVRWIWDDGDSIGDLPKLREVTAADSSDHAVKKLAAKRVLDAQKTPNDALADAYWKLRGYGISVKFDGTTLFAAYLTPDEAKIFANTASLLAPGGVLSLHTYPNGTSRAELRANHLKAVADWNEAKANAETDNEPITLNAKKYSGSVKSPEGLLQSNRDLEQFLHESAASILLNDGSASDTPGIHKFESGAVRSTEADGARYDLISPIALRKLAETCHEGAIKYNEKGCPPNWLKGMPMSDVMNHLLTHIYKWISGDTSEPHLPHAFWNLMALIHFEETRPDLMDVYPRKTALEAKDTEAMPRGC